MNYSTTNSSGHRGGAFSATSCPAWWEICHFLRAIKTNPHLYPGVGWVGVYFDWCIKRENSSHLGIVQSREFHNSKEIHRRIAPAASSGSFSQPQPQKKGRSSIIDSGDETVNRNVFVLTPELLVCSLCMNDFSSHDIVSHTK